MASKSGGLMSSVKTHNRAAVAVVERLKRTLDSRTNPEADTPSNRLMNVLAEDVTMLHRILLDEESSSSVLQDLLDEKFDVGIRYVRMARIGAMAPATAPGLRPYMQSELYVAKEAKRGRQIIADEAGYFRPPGVYAGYETATHWLGMEVADGVAIEFRRSPVMAWLARYESEREQIVKAEYKKRREDRMRRRLINTDDE